MTARIKFPPCLQGLASAMSVVKGRLVSMSVVRGAVFQSGGLVGSARNGSGLPPALIINLDRERGRWAHISSEATRAGLKFERVGAVAGLDVPDHLRAKFFSGNARTPTSLLLPGEVGCYASHLLAYERILESGLEWALVLEDDVRLSDDFVQTICETIAGLPGGWDIVRLSSRPRRAVMNLAQLKSGRHLVRYSKLPKQAGAQLVSAAGARKLLAEGLRVRPIDADLRYGYILGLDTFGVYPPPAEHGGLFRSSIKIAQGSRKDVRGGRWKSPKWYYRILGARNMLRTLGLCGAALCAITDCFAWAHRVTGGARPATPERPKAIADAAV